jgi:hypothetical protein
MQALQQTAQQRGVGCPAAPPSCRVGWQRLPLAAHRPPAEQQLVAPAWRVVARATGSDSDDLHENKLGPNVAAGIKDVKDGLTWRPATVIRNECVARVGCWVCADVTTPCDSSSGACCLSPP